MFISQLFESTNTTAVISYGRLNPPTTGHQLLVDSMIDTANKVGGIPILFLSRTQNNKTDPLDPDTKLRVARKFFPNIKIELSQTIATMLKEVHNMGFTDIVWVAGSDRAPLYRQLLSDYNGKSDKLGNVPFEFNSFRIVELARDPDSNDATGMSASKARAFVANDDLAGFTSCLPNPSIAKKLFELIKAGLTVPPKKVKQVNDLAISESMKNFDKTDPYNSTFSPDAGIGSMTLRGWKKNLAARISALNSELQKYTDPALIDNDMIWAKVNMLLGPNSNIQAIAKEIIDAHNELEAIRRKGGINSRGLVK